MKKKAVVSIDYQTLLSLIAEKASNYDQREYAGKLQYNWMDGGWKVVDLREGSVDGNSSRVIHREGEKNVISFHTHVLEPGEEYIRDMPVDIPSGQDIASIVRDTIYHRLDKHLLFTPGYTYILSLRAPQRKYLMGMKDRPKDLDSWLWYHVLYHWEGSLPKYQAPYATKYAYAWIKYMRKVGFNIERVEAGKKVHFEIEGEGGSSKEENSNLILVFLIIFILIAGGTALLIAM